MSENMAPSSNQAGSSALTNLASNPVKILNNINLIVSVGLLALGIVLIIYGFKMPQKKCDSKNTTECLNAYHVKKNGSSEDISEDVEMLRLVALITGFLLIIPFGLNIAEMILVYLPNTGGLTSFLDKVGSVANQSAYAMGSRHHKMHHGGYHGGHYRMKY